MGSWQSLLRIGVVWILNEGRHKMTTNGSWPCTDAEGTVARLDGETAEHSNQKIRGAMVSSENEEVLKLVV